MSRVTVLDHPLAADLLRRLRDVDTPREVFRDTAGRLGLLLVIEATRGLQTLEEEVTTPVGRAHVRRLSRPLVALVVLRAGLGLLPSLVELYPDAIVGFLGLEREEGTFEPTEYYRNLPAARGAPGLVLEPMLATGGSAAAAVVALREAGADPVTLVSVVAAPQGLDRLAAEHPDVPVITAAVDGRLDGRAFIVPGLGDFGDRLLGTIRGEAW
ncbi:MAG: uracil phosphoribosyltransferase [Actinomycetota bacterium]|nr:uracil phosphoribosyltransferase [Actinomycetota bacterium]